MGSVCRSMVVLTVVTMAAAIGRVGAQQQGQDCTTQLLPSLSSCLEAVQDPTKKPSSDCCKGVAYVLKNHLNCLCELYKTPPTGIPLNMTRILEIPTLCKVSASISQCKTGGSSTPSNHTPATSAPSPGPSSVPAPTSDMIRKRMIAIICSTVGILLLAIGICVLLSRSRKRKNFKEELRTYRSEMASLGNLTEVERNHELPHYSLKILQAATNNFSEENMLGRGDLAPYIRVVSMVSLLQ